MFRVARITTARPMAAGRWPSGTRVARHHTFLFAIDDHVVIDAAVHGNEARWLNHSCDPNCDAVIDDDRIWIETIRDVAPGEELTYDYAYVLEEGRVGGEPALSVSVSGGGMPAVGCGPSSGNLASPR